MLQLLPTAGYRQRLEVVSTKDTVRMHRALIVWPDGVERDSHVKLICAPPGLPPRQLLNEGIGWLIALACDLPVPPYAGYMLLSPALVTEAHPELTCPESGALAWISSTEPYRGLRITSEEMVNLMVAELCRWPHLAATLALDEWIANVDRHCGNLIRRGNSDFVLIDHDFALTGPHWLADMLFAGRRDDFTNRLYDIVESKIGHSSDACKDLRNAILMPAESFADRLSAKAAHLAEWLELLLSSAEDQWSLAAFLAYRSSNLPDAIKRRYRLLT